MERFKVQLPPTRAASSSSSCSPSTVSAAGNGSKSSSDRTLFLFLVPVQFSIDGTFNLAFAQLCHVDWQPPSNFPWTRSQHPVSSVFCPLTPSSLPLRSLIVSQSLLCKFRQFLLPPSRVFIVSKSGGGGGSS